MKIPINIKFTIILLLISYFSFSQETKTQESKIERFTSKKGTIVRYEDTKLPNIKSIYVFAKSRIRKIQIDNKEGLFLQISIKNKYGTETSSIAYEDLIEIRKALTNLQKQSEDDLNTEIDYIENKYTTEDKFNIGYYLEKNKINWYLSFEKATLFVKDPETFQEAFDLAIDKMNELKKI